MKYVRSFSVVLLAAFVFLLAVWSPRPASAAALGGACTTGETYASDIYGNNLICVASVWTANIYANAASGGNVGIGTTSPGTYKLNVNGTAKATGTLDLDNGAFFTGIAGAEPYGGGSGGTLAVTGGGTGTTTAFTQGSVPFAGAGGVYAQDNANFFWDNTNKRLGIGTTAPDATLDLGTNSPGGAPFLLLFNNHTGANVGFWRDTPAGNVAAFLVHSSGQISFGKTTTAATPTFGTEWMRIDNSGNVWIAGTLTQNSDQRLKENIKTLAERDGLAAIEQLNPVHFNWREGDKDHLQTGFIAQEIRRIFPNLVSTSSPTKLTPNGALTLDYIGLIPSVVKAIQQQQATIEKLEQEIESLKAARVH